MISLKSLLFVTVTSILEFINADSIPVMSCGGSASVQAVRLSGCTRFPCTLRKGSTSTIEFDFQAGKDANTVTNSVFGIINRISLPFIGVTGAPACQKTTPIDVRTGARAINVPSCPIFAGQSYTYKNSFPILSIYPTTDVTVQYGVIDSRGEKIACFLIPAKIA